uniref:Uncharacterized protein n=1 Tax=Scleropages formosus TaxID=113540 RepID=A0A8C9RD40_SCLFO
MIQQSFLWQFGIFHSVLVFWHLALALVLDRVLTSDWGGCERVEGGEGRGGDNASSSSSSSCVSSSSSSSLGLCSRSPFCRPTVWVRTCSCRQAERANKRRHTLQRKVSPPPCASSCCRNARKDLPQTSQWKGRSPVCSRWCMMRPAFCVKALSHCVHLKGFSPVCNRRCVLRWEARPKALPHSGCSARCDDEMKVLVQRGQLCGRSPVCVRLCNTKPEERAKRFSQEGHW